MGAIHLSESLSEGSLLSSLYKEGIVDRFGNRTKKSILVARRSWVPIMCNSYGGIYYMSFDPHVQCYKDPP